MDLRLQDRVFVVTGGKSGIGAACTKLLLDEGAHVAIWDLEQAADQTVGEHPHVIRVPCDISNPAAVANALATTQNALGNLHGLVHAAAIGSGAFGFPFTNVSPDKWPRVLEINIMGMVHIAHAIAPCLAKQQDGAMVFIASVAGQMGSQTDPPYSASKAANINFAQCLAKDLASANVRVNTVCPGMVQTPLNRGVWQAWYDQQPADQRLSYEAWAGNKIRQVVPLGRWQTPEDIADLVVFLLSDRSRNITGQTMNVDGGFVMHW